ncbi:hypothetical protein [Seohaeicola zhoushanensis]|uniref:EfeO-type cupredoxin-like domain-containing protein n=1 Tax=Seohaeicola zhoushanensis TaxID=1569283 RepID=A0A8J3MB45_9RHOB|nr:hypothetical protein [Seohaeicola zhoushanensis]GHF72918.1 hypothetical protein GCM10017056_49730 [Seohaeicola zhoushanensis]
MASNRIVTLAVVFGSALYPAEPLVAATGLDPDSPVWRVGAEDSVEVAVQLDLKTAQTVQVAVGSKVRLIVQSPQALELHFHAFDQSARVSPGKPAEFAFQATRTGRFAIEAHGIVDALGRHERVVLYVEVRPR